MLLIPSVITGDSLIAVEIIKGSVLCKAYNFKYSPGYRRIPSVKITLKGGGLNVVHIHQSEG